jgi:hypothetical protein
VNPPSGDESRDDAAIRVEAVARAKELFGDDLPPERMRELVDAYVVNTRGDAEALTNIKRELGEPKVRRITAKADTEHERKIALLKAGVAMYQRRAALYRRDLARLNNAPRADRPGLDRPAGRSESHRARTCASGSPPARDRPREPDDDELAPEPGGSACPPALSYREPPRLVIELALEGIATARLHTFSEEDERRLTWWLVHSPAAFNTLADTIQRLFAHLDAIESGDEP